MSIELNDAAFAGGGTLRPYAQTRAVATDIGYVAQIDTLRCIAVAFVFLEHYLPDQTHDLGISGGYGVWTFFAISGFLITNILLNYKAAIENSRTTLPRALRVFYARRSLRIFPVYYLLLLILLASGLVAWRGEFFWHLTYTTNFWAVKYKTWGYAGHFWSLAVEEQFYLMWPLLVLLAPRSSLIWLIGAGIVGALIFRLWAISLDLRIVAYTMPMANFDTLGAGALLAWLHNRGSERTLAALRRHGGWVLLLVPWMSFWPHALGSVLDPAVIGFIAMYLIERCIAGFDGIVGRLFALKPIIYLGRISYGLYLYHGVICWYLPKAWFASIGEPYGPYVAALVWTAATIAVAALSWHFFEAPINGLKRNFRIASM